MDYSSLAVIKNCLDSFEILASKLKALSTGKAINDSKLRMIVAEIEETTSRVSRILSFEKNRDVLSKYSITPQELYVLNARIDDDTRKSLLKGSVLAFYSVSKTLLKSSQLWRKRIILPAEKEMSGLKKTVDVQSQKNETTANCRVLLLLGAGASTPLHIPTMTDFWPLIQANCKSDEEQFAINMLLNAAKDQTTHLPPDLEIILMMLDRYKTYFGVLWEDPYFGLQDNMKYQLVTAHPPLSKKRENRLKQFMRRFGLFSKENQLEQFMHRCGWSSMGISRIRTKITRIMESLYAQQLNKDAVVSLYMPLLLALERHFKDNNIAIFTTNYDTVIEQYSAHQNLRLIDGFQKIGASLMWHPAEYSRKLNPDEKSITLFKLHGSFTWRKIGNEIIEFGLSTPGIPGDMALIYPTETKEYPYEEPFKTAYKSLDRLLRIAEVVIIIGYSFRDRGITYIIDEAKSDNPNLRFIIICGDKSDEDTRKRFPPESQILQCNFGIGANAEYLTQLNELLNEHSQSS